MEVINCTVHVYALWENELVATSAVEQICVVFHSELICIWAVPAQECAVSLRVHLADRKMMC